MRGGGILVYAGEGSSHSWTWLADLFESRGIFDARFVDAPGLAELLRDRPETVIVSGGDGLLIADAFRGRTFSGLESHVRAGGRYVGMCAGAYLPLPSSLAPLSEFNLSTTRIENLGPRVDPGTTPRLSVPYGSCSIVHPIRGEVSLRWDGVDVTAPLYGGPVFREPDDDHVLLRYSGFTDGTEFQMERARAKSMVLGRPAAILSRVGSGELLLFGPHLEHPRYPEANAVFLKLIGSPAGRARGRLDPGSTSAPDGLRAALADLKVAILGLENRSFLVGNKLWDGGRFLDLASAMEKRTSFLDGGTAGRVTEKVVRARDMLAAGSPESFACSDSAPSLLVDAARECVGRHFAALRRYG